MHTLKSNNQLTIEDVVPEDALNNNEAKKEFDQIEEIEKGVDKEKLTYKTSEYRFSFENFETKKTFGRDIYEGKITIKAVDEYQKDLLVEIMSFRKNTKPMSQVKKREKEFILKNVYNFFEGRGNVVNTFESKIFLTKSKSAGILNPNHSKLKTLKHKQMLQRRPIALAQVKTGKKFY